MTKRAILVVAVCVLASNVSASTDTFGTGANQFTIDFVDISGDASSANGLVIGTDRTFIDPTNDYRIGKFEITNDQWNKFKASVGGTVTGSPSDAYDESPSFTSGDVPTSYISWYEAAQFVNYLNTSTGHKEAYKFIGTQGTSDYTLSVWQSGDVGYDADNPYRNSEAFYFMPTEDEWVKAAYFNGTSLQTYATTDNSIPTAGIDTNYNSSLSHPWDVGSGTEELNGTFDMMGNAYEWIESPMDRGDYLSPVRGVRGGSYGSTQLTLEVSYRDYAGFQNYEGPYYGFRVASVATPNNPPVADAGDDQAIYVCIDGIAEVTLDGSDSSDIDYNELTYYWSWMIDDEIYDANGVAPIIELPVGKYIIQLIVNDGIEDSEPNEVVVTMIDSIELLDILADYIIDLGLHSRIESSLLAKIDTAIDKLEDDNDKNDKAAISSLRAFINAVKAQSGKKILQEDAGYLIETAQQAIDVSSCE